MARRRCAPSLPPWCGLLFIVVAPILVPVVASMAVIKVYDKTQNALVRARKHHRAAARHLPKSEPLLDENSFTSGNGCKKNEKKKKPSLKCFNLGRSRDQKRPPATRERQAACFLDLPIELRRLIYTMATEQQRFVQPTTGKPFWGYQSPSDSWPLQKRIRCDSDPPSMSLQLIVGLGGFWLDQNPAPKRPGGCVRHCVRQAPAQMLFLHESVMRRRDFWSMPPSGTGQRLEHIDLMQTCREVYADMLDVLYGGPTVCLFGAEMIRYFLRNASPEGLPAVRFVEAALLVDARKWDTRSSRKTIKSALRGLADKMTGLKQLHVEVVLMFGQPGGSSKGDAGSKFWTWLRDMFEASGLSGLDKFVLKISVYTPEVGIKPTPRDQEATQLPARYGRWMHQVVPFAAWREDEYQALKTNLTTK